MIRKFGKWEPVISKNAIIDESAQIIGNVIVEDNVTVWPGAIIRADEYEVVIRRNAVILDVAFIEAHGGVEIGEGSVISHRAIVHGGKIGKNVLIGISATILGKNIGDNSIVAAGAIVTKDFGANSFLLGIPAKMIRDVSKEEAEETRRIADELRNKAAWLKI